MVSTRVRMLVATAVAGACLAPTAAWAGNDPYGGGSSVPRSATASTVGPAGDPGDPADEGSLPLTGGDVVSLTAIAVGALAGGLALARQGRRRAAA
jgi:hypothetical protein